MVDKIQVDWSILDFSKIPDEIPQNSFEKKVDEYELVFVIKNRYLVQENHTDIYKSTKHKKKKSNIFMLRIWTSHWEGCKLKESKHVWVLQSAKSAE